MCNTLNADIFMFSLDTSASPRLSLPRRACRGSTWRFNGVSSHFHLINHLTSPSQNTLPSTLSKCCLSLAPFLSVPLLPPPGRQSSRGESRQHTGGQRGQRGSWQRVRHFQSARLGLPNSPAPALLRDVQEASAPGPVYGFPTTSQVAYILLVVRGGPL